MIGARIVLTATAALAAAIWVSAQQAPRLTFRAAVSLIAVEVQVVGDDGWPIVTLGPRDFRVKIDGRERRVVSVEFVKFTGAGAATAWRTAGGTRPTHDRYFVLAIDEASFGPSDAMAAAHAARGFIDLLRPEDYVGLFRFPTISSELALTHGHAAVKAALSKVNGDYRRFHGEFDLLPSEIVDLTAHDTEVWQQIVRRACPPYDRGCPGRILQDARSAASQAEGDADRRVEALQLLLDSLADVPGRKTLVVMSGGLFAADRASGRPDIASSMMEVGRNAALANTVLYVLHADSSFLQSLTRQPLLAAAAGDVPPFAKSFRDTRVFGLGLEQLAATAGGGYIRVEAGTPDFAFARIVRESAAYYLLGVEPDDAERDGQLHYLRVEADAERAKIRSRTHVVIPRRR